MLKGGDPTYQQQLHPPLLTPPIRSHLSLYQFTGRVSQHLALWVGGGGGGLVQILVIMRTGEGERAYTAAGEQARG